MTYECPRCHGLRTQPGGRGPCRYCNGVGARPDAQLSPHFRLSEFVRSATAKRLSIPNDPSPAVLANLRTFAKSLEPVRELSGGPVSLSSGYRCDALNRAIGGSSSSVHDDGFAGDLLLKGCTREQLVRRIVDAGLPFDQLILEESWLHFGLFSPRGEQRRQVKRQARPGAPYVSFDPLALAA